jgi:hypothetical protein
MTAHDACFSTSNQHNTWKFYRLVYNHRLSFSYGIELSNFIKYKNSRQTLHSRILGFSYATEVIQPAWNADLLIAFGFSAIVIDLGDRTGRI